MTETATLTKPGMEYSQQGPDIDKKAEYSSYLRVKITRKKEIGTDGKETIVIQETKVLSEEGKKTAKADYQKMCQNGFDELGRELAKLRQEIKEHDKAPAHERMLTPDQRIYYGRLIKSCEIQYRNNLTLGVKEEISAKDNQWNSIVDKYARKRKPQEPITNTQRKFARNALANEIYKLRKQQVEILTKELQLNEKHVEKALKLAEQNILLQNPLIDSPKTLFTSEELKRYVSRYATELAKEPKGDLPLDRVIDGLRTPAKTEKARKKQSLRGKAAMAIVSAGMLVGLITGNPGIMDTGKHVVSSPIEYGQLYVRVVEERADDVKRIIESKFSSHTGLEDKSIETAQENQTSTPKKPEPPLYMNRPTIEELIEAKSNQRLDTAENCMTIATLESPEYKGTAFGGKFPVVVYNNATPEEIVKTCAELFPHLANQKDIPTWKLEKATPLRQVQVPQSYKDANPNIVYAPGKDGAFKAYRQIDGTCFLTTVASTIESIMESQGMPGITPYTLSELIRIPVNTKQDISEQKGGKPVANSTVNYSPIDISYFNVAYSEVADNPLFKRLGIKTSVTGISEGLTSYDGLRLNIDNTNLVKLPSEFWQESANQVARTYKQLIDKGENPIFISQVYKDVNHAVTVVGIDMGNANRPPKLIVYESANQGEGGWDYTDGKDVPQGSRWKDIPGTRGLREIPLTEWTIRTMIQADGDRFIFSFAPANTKGDLNVPSASTPLKQG